jgi:hypothetical protein
MLFLRSHVECRRWTPRSSRVQTVLLANRTCAATRAVHQQELYLLLEEVSTYAQVRSLLFVPRPTEIAARLCPTKHRWKRTSHLAKGRWQKQWKLGPQREEKKSTFRSSSLWCRGPDAREAQWQLLVLSSFYCFCFNLTCGTWCALCWKLYRLTVYQWCIHFIRKVRDLKWGEM